MKISETSVRVFIVCIGLLGALFAPWWVPLVCMALLSLRFASWEVLVLGLLMDFLWLPGGGHFSVPFFLITGIVLVWVCAPLRSQFLIH